MQTPSRKRVDQNVLCEKQYDLDISSPWSWPWDPSFGIGLGLGLGTQAFGLDLALILEGIFQSLVTSVLGLGLGSLAVVNITGYTGEVESIQCWQLINFSAHGLKPAGQVIWHSNKVEAIKQAY